MRRARCAWHGQEGLGRLSLRYYAIPEAATCPRFFMPIGCGSKPWTRAPQFRSKSGLKPIFQFFSQKFAGAVEARFDGFGGSVGDGGGFGGGFFLPFAQDDCLAQVVGKFQYGSPHGLRSFSAVSRLLRIQ